MKHFIEICESASSKEISFMSEIGIDRDSMNFLRNEMLNFLRKGKI